MGTGSHGPEATFMNDLLLSPAQAAETLGISRSKLYDLLRTGDIRSLSIGTARCIAISEIREFIEQHQTDSLGPVKR